MKITTYLGKGDWIEIESIDKPKKIGGVNITEGYEIHIFSPRGRRLMGESLSRFQLENLQKVIGIFLEQCKHGVQEQEECQACEE